MEIRPIDSAGAIATATNSNLQAENEFPLRQVVTAVREINKSELLGQGRQLNFTRDPDTHKPVIQIVDQNSGEVIDQLPPESVVRLAKLK